MHFLLFTDYTPEMFEVVLSGDDPFSCFRGNITNDNVPEETETFQLILDDPMIPNVIVNVAADEVLVTILDDDLRKHSQL